MQRDRRGGWASSEKIAEVIREQARMLLPISLKKNKRRGAATLRRRGEKDVFEFPQRLSVTAPLRKELLVSS